jgi:hypothetical protein
MAQTQSSELKCRWIPKIYVNGETVLLMACTSTDRTQLRTPRRASSHDPYYLDGEVLRTGALSQMSESQV